MSKKTKGQKIDWATFAKDNEPEMSLPTASDPNRFHLFRLKQLTIIYY